MRRHWSEVHGLSEASLDFSSLAFPVKLQTFFRGTKHRYFEINSSLVVPTNEATSLATSGDEKHDDTEQTAERYDEEDHDSDITITPPPSRILTSTKASSKLSPINIDLEMFTYFHHFTTATYLTLPCPKHPQPTAHYWQIDVVPKALQQRWLMCGILAISACHTAMVVDDEMIRQVHHERAMQFSSEFFAVWDAMRQTDSDFGAAEIGDTVKSLGRRVMCILNLARCALESTLIQGVAPVSAPYELQSILTTLREYEDYSCGIQSSDDERQQASFFEASRILATKSSSAVSHSSPDKSSTGTPSDHFNRLRDLPLRMSETFGKPVSSQDFMATVAAIATLVECCELSLTSDEVESTWWGMATWWTKVSDHFIVLVSHDDPAALVILAYWAALLVERAECYGCWFLSGSTRSILRQVTERLPANDHKIQNLVLFRECDV